MNDRSRTKPQKKVIECLYCNEDIYLGGNPKIGNIVECKNCESLFEIVDLEPVMIDWPFYADDYPDDEDLLDYE